MSEFASFLVPAVVGLGLALATWLVARRSGMLPLQNNLVDTLQDTVEALEKQVKLTADEKERAAAAAEACAVKVSALTDAVVDLASENATLRRRYRLPRRQAKPIEREVVG